jgi:hypothetical protein
MRCILACVSCVAAFGALAQDDSDLSDENLRCIRSISIERTKPINDSTIAFYLRNGDVYINAMPRNCPGLARYQRFAYETRSGRLCSKDRVAVIYDTGGQETGLPCPLGEFQPTDPELVDLMIAAEERGGSASPVTAEPVELPNDDDEYEAADAENLDSTGRLQLE